MTLYLVLYSAGGVLCKHNVYAGNIYTKRQAQCPSSLLVGMSCLLPGDIDAQLNTANPT